MSEKLSDRLSEVPAELEDAAGMSTETLEIVARVVTTEGVVQAVAAAPRLTADSSYFLVFERDSSWVFQLPPDGEIDIGRSDTVALMLRDPSVSRRHARVTRVGDDACITDANSQNGTYVNGARLQGTRLLVSGDMITLSGVTLVYHARAPRAPVASFVDPARFRERADEELERALRHGRSWAVVAIDLGVTTDRVRVEAALALALRRIDLVMWDGEDQLLALVPETGADASAAAARLLGGVTAVAPLARAGVASCPGDGCDVSVLIASARAAAREAAPTRVQAAARSYRTFEIGGRKAVVADPAMVRLYALVEQRLAVASMPVLVHGETGTGKELVAAALHHWSARRGRPYVTLNCATIPEQLVESELFGHEKGAFSGAVAHKQGLLPLASGGTLFLDEIGEMPLGVQAKLLRVLETGRVRPLGDVHERVVDVRIVAASNRNLEEEVAAGRFRKDLYYRLKGATLWLPPLRNRARELPILAQALLDEACRRAGRPPMTIADAALRRMTTHPWPGNVRELQSLVEYMAAVVKEPVLEPHHLDDWLGGAPAAAPPDETATAAAGPAEARVETIGPRRIIESSRPGREERGDPTVPRFRPIGDELRDLEKQRMAEALAATGGNRTRAAELIQMPLRTFVSKLKTYNLDAEGTNWSTRNSIRP